MAGPSKQPRPDEHSHNAVEYSPENDEDELDDEQEPYDDDDEPETLESPVRPGRDYEELGNRMQSEPITLRVHDVIIKGNTKTKDYVIEAEIIDLLRRAATLQEVLQAAGVGAARLMQLGVFENVSIVLDAGPRELPRTTNVVVEVLEYKDPLSGDIGFYTRPGARSWSLDGSLKLKNLFGHADMWEGSVTYGLDQTTEVSAGVSLPRFGRWPTPVFARASMFSQDWLKLSSYKEQTLGLALGLLSTRNHELTYNMTWRTLTDPSQMAGMSVRRQLGHSLLSSLKYTFKVDRRDSPLRPTRGYAFSSTTLLAGLNPDARSARFLRQECDVRLALPLGIFRAALNLGVSGGVIFPWGKGYLDRPSSIPDRFFMGGNTSPVCSLAGPTSLFGFQSRGLGPTEPRRQARDSPVPVPDSGTTTSERDALGGDLAVSAFADLSFDLPVRFLQEAGIHGHVFACAGSLAKLTENEWRSFSPKNFMQSFRSSVGCGVIVPTKLLRMEVNYCHIMRQFEHDHGKTGVQFSFSAPL